MLFAELIGAAELYGRADDTTAFEIIAHNAARVSQAAESCGARVIKTTGSKVMLLAASADAAAAAAVAMQVEAWDFPGAQAGLALGVGFHYGPVIEVSGDVFGDTVNLAARLTEQAARGQILFAAATVEALAPRYRRLMRRLYDVPLKGRSEEVALCELVWRADQAPTMFPARGAETPPAKLKLKYHGKKMVLRGSHDVFTIGRAAGCELVVDRRRGLAPPLHDPAAQRPLRARRPEHQRHVRHRGGRRRGAAQARGADAAQARLDLARRPARRGGRGARVFLRLQRGQDLRIKGPEFRVSRSAKREFGP